MTAAVAPNVVPALSRRRGWIIGRVVDATHTYAYVLVGLAVWLFPGCLLWLFWKAPPRYVEPATAS